MTVIYRDSEWTRIQTTAARKTLLLGQIKMASHNLYTLMYKHLQRKVPAMESEDTMMQLGRVLYCLQSIAKPVMLCFFSSNSYRYLSKT